MRIERDVDEISSARGKDLSEKSFSLVSLQDVTLGYGSTRVVGNVNLAIYSGSLIGLAGPNGVIAIPIAFRRARASSAYHENGYRETVAV